VFAATALISTLVTTRTSADLSKVPVGSIVGHVVWHGGPVLLADVFVVAPRVFVMSDENGGFRLEHVAAGARTVVIRAQGCRTESLSVQVRENTVDSLLVWIQCPGRVDRNRLQPNPDEVARVGQPCSRHPDVRLARDEIPIRYGLIVYTPAMMRFMALERDSFPNARMTLDGGCMVGSPGDTLGTAGKMEVAYCWKCREELARRRPTGDQH
jgi:hypothetical protein